MLCTSLVVVGSLLAIAVAQADTHEAGASTVLDGVTATSIPNGATASPFFGPIYYIPASPSDELQQKAIRRLPEDVAPSFPHHFTPMPTPIHDDHAG